MFPSTDLPPHFDERVSNQNLISVIARDLKSEPGVDVIVRLKRHGIFVPGNDSTPQGLRLQTT